MVDRFLSKTGVGFGLLFMVIQLTYINMLSLQYMFGWGDITTSEIIFGINGALAFSIVTVLIMRLSKKEWLKIAFPIFDIALVFCGFNLRHADDIFSNPVRFAMSIFLALFSGLITYSLGQINADQHSGLEADKKLLESENEKLKSDLLQAKGILEALQRNYEKLTSEYKVTYEGNATLQSKTNEVTSNYQKLYSDFENMKSNYESLKTQLKVTQEEVKKYKSSAMAAEIARLRKKKPANLTPEEKELLKTAA